MQFEQCSALISLFKSNHLQTLKHVESHLSIDEIKQALEADYYMSLWNVMLMKSDVTVRNHILNIEPAFAFTESHDKEFGIDNTYLFVSEKLAKLQYNKEKFELANPNGVFDLNEKESRFCFYVIRNLIRRGVETEYRAREELHDELVFLLNIPSVKALCHQRISGGPENELLRLALSLGNDDACSLLFSIPAVSALAEAHDFYREENRNGVDLARLAGDDESSMVALTSGEKKRLDQASKVYQPIIKNRGVAQVIQEFLERLKSRYTQSPAYFIDAQGQKRELPLDYQSYQQMNLNDVERNNANIAYYQHPDHTALRYLSKPNFWMDLNAGYILRNDDNTAGWSTFEEYLPLIALLYLATIDELHPPTEKSVSIADRLVLFIKQIALTGRAHNWDEVSYDEKGNEFEYDDLKGDKPSCFSGVNRRLFQSVLFHPLLSVISIDIVMNVLREELRDLFKKKITEDNKEILLAAFSESYENPNACDTKPLQILDLTAADQNSILNNIVKRLGSAYIEDPSFKRRVLRELSLKNNLGVQLFPCHAIKFDGLIQIYSSLLGGKIQPVVQPDIPEMKSSETALGILKAAVVEAVKRYEEHPKPARGLFFQASGNIINIKSSIDKLTEQQQAIELIVHSLQDSELPTLFIKQFLPQAINQRSHLLGMTPYDTESPDDIREHVLKQLQVKLVVVKTEMVSVDNTEVRKSF